jgi:hypothetical protein
MQTYCPYDGLVIDPFAGARTTAIAAALEHVHYWTEGPRMGESKKQGTKSVAMEALLREVAASRDLLAMRRAAFERLQREEIG